MSHFTVLVIGENPEKQLKPYDENIKVPEYETGKVPQSEIDSMVEHYVKTKGYQLLNDFEDMYKKHGRDWNGGSWRKHTDGTWHEYSTYNPNSQWDWYLLGGRWTGFFKLKKGVAGKIGKPGVMTENAKLGYANQALKKHIDFDLMRKEAAEHAADDYDKAMKLFGDKPVQESWGSVRDRIKDIEHARAFYNNQVRCKTPGIWDADKYLINREQFIQNASDNAISTFAVIKDGKWYEKGDMRWFGVVLDEKEQTAWNGEFKALIDDLSEDTLLSVYDCHI